MNQDGTFETRKEIYEALFRGETITHCDSKASYHYVRSVDQFSDGKGNAYSSLCIEDPSNWRILKPKKRRVIKDYKKLAGAMIDKYLMEDGYFDNRWIFNFLGRDVMRLDDNRKWLYYLKSGDEQQTYYVIEEWTEEYDDDERSKT